MFYNLPSVPQTVPNKQIHMIMEQSESESCASCQFGLMVQRGSMINFDSAKIAFIFISFIDRNCSMKGGLPRKNPNDLLNTNATR